jgi:hypothetical protein
MEKFGSEIRDGKKVGSGIRDKHPGSATLLVSSLKKLLEEKSIFGILFAVGSQ